MKNEITIFVWKNEKMPKDVVFYRKTSYLCEDITPKKMRYEENHDECSLRIGCNEFFVRS